MKSFFFFSNNFKIFSLVRIVFFCFFNIHTEQSFCAKKSSAKSFCAEILGKMTGIGNISFCHSHVGDVLFFFCFFFSFSIFVGKSGWIPFFFLTGVSAHREMDWERVRKSDEIGTERQGESPREWIFNQWKTSKFSGKRKRKRETSVCHGQFCWTARQSHDVFRYRNRGKMVNWKALLLHSFDIIVSIASLNGETKQKNV